MKEIIEEKNSVLMRMRREFSGIYKESDGD